MGRDQRRVEGNGEDETVKRQTRRGGGGCRRCYGLLHINIYDFDLIHDSKWLSSPHRK